MNQSGKSAGDMTFKLGGVSRPPIDFCGNVVGVLFVVATILATKMILVTAFFGDSIKSIEHVRRRIVQKIGRRVPVFAPFTDITITHVGLAKAEECKREGVCEVVKLTTDPPNSEAVLTMATKSSGTFIMGAKRELTVQTRLLVALGICRCLLK